MTHSSAPAHPKVTATARDLIDGNLYLTLGTADAEGRPWVAPVFYTADGYADFYWVSSPDAVHSRNLAVRPEVSLVVFDSRAPLGAAEAVYMSARAHEVPAEDVPRAAEVFRARMPDMDVFAPEALRGPSPLRLYRATVVEHSGLVRGGDPEYGRPVDSRVPIALG
jgi:nitroimidazol reductase NimA-like FMN-containing flavoprotein (pyridoxamine 5'-phosphate oxidase superfamily)